MHLIDTNIFLEFLLGQKRKDECVSLIKKAISGDLRINITRFCIYSIEIALSRDKKIDELKNFLAIIRSSKGIKIINSDITDDEQIIDLMKKYNTNENNASQYSTSPHFNCQRASTKIITFSALKHSNQSRQRNGWRTIIIKKYQA